VLARVKLPASAREDVPPTLSNALNWTILVLVIVAVLVKCGVALAPATVSKAQQQIAPVRAVEWLKQNRQSGPMYNSYNWGGYLLWALPQEPVFVDGRTDLYDDEFLHEYFQVMFIRPDGTSPSGGWQDVLDKYGVRLALIERESLLAAMLMAQPDWRLVYGDDLAVIYAHEGK
jgi:hypothetical protein